MTPSGTTESQTEIPEHALGTLLRCARDERRISVPDVARALILSAAQIKGMESGSLAAFHNRTYYLRALKKYLDYLGIAAQAPTLSLLARLEQQVAEHDGRTSQKEVNLLLDSVLHPSKKTLLIPKKRIHFVLGAMAVLVGVGLVATTLKQKLPSMGSATAVATQADSRQNTVQTNQSIAAIVSPEAEPKVLTAKQVQAEQRIPDAAATVTNQTALAANPVQPDTEQPITTKVLKLSFMAPSWVQLITRDGKRAEKIFSPQEVLDIDPLNTVSIVIGNARESSLSAGGINIDLGKFINPNSSVARISQQDLNSMTDL